MITKSQLKLWRSRKLVQRHIAELRYSEHFCRRLLEDLHTLTKVTRTFKIKITIPVAPDQ